VGTDYFLNTVDLSGGCYVFGSLYGHHVQNKGGLVLGKYIKKGDAKRRQKERKKGEG